MSRPFGADFISAFAKKHPYGQANVLLPSQWLAENPQLKKLHAFSYQQNTWDAADIISQSDTDEICLLSGRGLYAIDADQIEERLKALSWDVVSIQVSPHLQASQETLKLTPASNVVGFRRFYTASVEPTAPPSQWPDILMIKRHAWDSICPDGHLPLDFGELKQRLGQQQCRLVSLRVGGQSRSFDTPTAFLDCLEEFEFDAVVEGDGYRAVGPIFKGDGVTIEPGATLVGPVVLSDHVHVKSGAVVRRSILTEHTVIEDNQVVDNQIVLHGETDIPAVRESGDGACRCVNQGRLAMLREEYKNWPLCSYARFGKRLFDILAATVVLIMLVPIFAVVTVILKLTSPGPIFYRARRQGLHGRDFDCLKFRSMMVEADTMQERLRAVNQVDGPQFKMDNDPRITGVGKFLRDTYIDELPQFINVLLGQMSIVGPRPSPENENESSPAWRDARLSVRPGITGLWQVMRTRKEGVDFQEWVFYDTRYVRNLSFRKDLWICWKTAQKLIHSFLGQFG